jgi:hypothetical protein
VQIYDAASTLVCDDIGGATGGRVLPVVIALVPLTAIITALPVAAQHPTPPAPTVTASPAPISPPLPVAATAFNLPYRIVLTGPATAAAGTDIV